MQASVLESMEAIIFRRATAGDADSIWQVRIRAIRSGCKDHYSPNIIEAWVSSPLPTSFPSFIEDEPFFVAELRSKVVGFAGLKRGTSEVDALFVSPEVAGAGLGTKLLKHVEQMARELLIPKLVLDASLNSVRFYKAAGYSEGQQGMHTTTSGLQIACVHMEKSLAGTRA